MAANPNDKFQYQLVDDINQVQVAKRRRPRSRLIVAIPAIFAVVCLTTAWTVWRTTSSPEHPFVTDCGRRSSEAIARGCVMEPLIYGWFPPQCSYDEVTDQHNPFEDGRKWYSDEAMTTELNSTQLWRGEHVNVWTTANHYHTEHCLFLYQKLAYSVAKRQTWLDKKTMSWYHADHCVKQLMSGTEAPSASIHVVLGLYTCDRTPWAGR